MKKNNYFSALKWSVWLIAVYILVQLVLGLVIASLKKVGVFNLENVNTVLNATIATAVYVCMIFAFISIPKKLGKDVKSIVLGVDRIPSVGWVLSIPLIFFGCLIASGVAMLVITYLIPGFNATQEQQIGFDQPSFNYEYILTFLTLVVIGPIAEEIWVRGYLLGKLRLLINPIGGVLVSALIFGMLHLGFQLPLQWNVFVDTFIFGIVLAILRIKSDSIWPSILLHMLKNGIAFYALFILKISGI